MYEGGALVLLGALSQDFNADDFIVTDEGMTQSLLPLIT